MIGLFACAPACTAAHRIARASEVREEASWRGWSARHTDEQVGAGVVRNSQVPRVYCFDGSLSLTCTPERAASADCCPNQGGVYRDRWGNVVAR